MNSMNINTSDDSTSKKIAELEKEKAEEMIKISHEEGHLLVSASSFKDINFKNTELGQKFLLYIQEAEKVIQVLFFNLIFLNF